MLLNAPRREGDFIRVRAVLEVMSDLALTDLTVHEARNLLDRREVSSVELTRAALARIAKVEDSVKAFVTVTEDLALQAGKRR